MTDPESVAGGSKAKDDIAPNVSDDLAVELQSKLFEQLTSLGVAGAGLTITLVGTILKGSLLIWLATVEFGLAGLVALTGQTQLIEGLFESRPIRRRARIVTAIAAVLIGMGIGSLGASVYLEGKMQREESRQAAP